MCFGGSTTSPPGIYIYIYIVCWYMVWSAGMPWSRGRVVLASVSTNKQAPLTYAGMPRVPLALMDPDPRCPSFHFEGWDVPEVAWAFEEKAEAEKEALREEISNAIKLGLKDEAAGSDDGLPPRPWTSMLTCKCPEGATTRETHPGCCRWRVVRPFLVQYRCDTFVHYRRECRPGELAIDPLRPGPLSTMMFVKVVKLDWEPPPWAALDRVTQLGPDLVWSQRPGDPRPPIGPHPPIYSAPPSEEDETGREWAAMERAAGRSYTEEEWEAWRVASPGGKESRAALERAADLGLGRPAGAGKGRAGPDNAAGAVPGTLGLALAARARGKGGCVEPAPPLPKAALPQIGGWGAGGMGKGNEG